MNRIISKRRFWILNSAVLLIIIISFLYITAVGTHYDIHSHYYFSEDHGFTYTSKCSVPGVVETGEAYIDSDGELILPLKSVAKGKTDLILNITSLESGTTLTANTSVTVNALGTIFEHSDYLFNFNGYTVIVIQIMVVLAMILGVMVFTYVEMQKKALFSYPMIAAGGMALFTTILIAFLVYKMLNHMVTSFSAFVALITDTGTQFLLAMAPFMLVLAIALSVSNIWLLHNEGYRPVNALGIAFSIVWIAGMVISFNLMFSDVLHIENYRIADSLNRAFIYLCCYFECMLLSTAVSAFSASRHIPPFDRDYIVILGCAIRQDGTPTPLLRMRTDSAVAFERAQYEKSGKHAVFVPSGGQGSDEIISEAESMRRYLTQQGVPAEQIATEDQSKSTYENMRFSKAVIEKRSGDITKKKIAFATTNYHIFRGYVLARKNGFEAQGISAKTKWYFFPNAFLREFIGLLVDRKLWHIMQIVCFIAIFVGLGNIL